MAGDGNASRTNNQDFSATRNPAVGFIATATNEDALVRELLRARMHGFQSFVTHYCEPDLTAIEYAEELGATVVHPAKENPSQEFLRQELAATARSESYSGLLFHATAETQIYYEQSLAALKDGPYAVETIRTESSPHQQSAVSVLVGIPAYNEAETIASVVKEAIEYADAVVVVDDGSNDSTATVAREAGANVLEHYQNRGYGAALKTLFEYGHKHDVDHLVILDGDGQHEPSDIPRLIDAQTEADAGLVIGSRLQSDGDTDMPLYRWAGLFVINLLSNISFGQFRRKDHISDTQSGFRAYDQQALETLVESNGISNNMGASTDILYELKNSGCNIKEVGVQVKYDVENANSIHPLSHGFALVGNILRTVENEHPIGSIGIPGILLILLGFGFGYRTIVLYSMNNTFPPGHAMLSLFLTLAGIFACFTAIILHSLTSKLPDYE